MKDYIYFQMRAYLYPKEESQIVQFKLNELEKLWYCSQKNVKRRLKKFSDAGKIIYIPGKGRGNPSEMKFSFAFQEEIERKVLEFIQQDQLESIVSLLQLPIPKTWIANVSKEVQNLFGFQQSNQSKDFLRTIITRSLTTIDPIYASVTFETYLIRQLGDSLVTYNQELDLVEPHIAHHWEENQSKIWVFYLRKGVRFHNRNILTSKDVKYTLERFQINSSPHSWLVEDIEKIECVSPYILRITLKRSNPMFLRYLSSHNLVILPVNEHFDEKKWIGTGPFQMKKRTDTLLVLSAFDDYFLSRPLLDEVEFYRVPIETTVTYGVDNPNGNRDGYLEQKEVEVGFRFVAFNFMKNTIVHDKFFREALYHLMDMNRLWKDLNRSNLNEASSYFFWKSKQLSKDTEKVISLLKKSKYCGEMISLYALEKPTYLEEAKWLQNEAQKAGINIEITAFNLEEFYDPLLEKADLLLMGEVASTDYHVSFIGAFLNKALIFNLFFTEKQLMELNVYFEKIKQVGSAKEREVWIDAAERYIRKENLFLYLYHPVKHQTFHPMIKDIEFESFGYVDLRKLWINNI
ncbi:SgrR family transcriptional regulator [Bacillus sp. JJ722]|uniref:SgrR family transcriptional regulator n=1 Tax=Bacillus sp. JJ722 TaxID=3122973 RepID=UPI002FFE42A0